MYQNHKIAVVIPVLNEEESISKVINDIPGYVDQLIVADNGSSDNTVEIAKSQGATTVFEPVKGYGSACLKGIQKLKNKMPHKKVCSFHYFRDLKLYPRNPKIIEEEEKVHHLTFATPVN